MRGGGSCGAEKSAVRAILIACRTRAYEHQKGNKSIEITITFSDSSGNNRHPHMGSLILQECAGVRAQAVYHGGKLSSEEKS